MLKIIITGGIATGKSTVTQYLLDKGYPVIDADQVSRQVVEVGQPGLEKLKQAFGPEIIHPDGTLNRSALGDIIFNDDRERHKLNEILHPLIFQAIQDQIQAYQESNEAIVFLDIPLFYESQSKYAYDEVWLVYTDESTQLQRLMERNQLSEADAQARLDSQEGIEVKKAYDNFIIDNSGSLENTYEQVDQALQRLNLL